MIATVTAIALSDGQKTFIVTAHDHYFMPSDFVLIQSGTFDDAREALAFDCGVYEALVISAGHDICHVVWEIRPGEHEPRVLSGTYCYPCVRQFERIAQEKLR